MSARGQSGVALILVILVTSFLSAAGLGLVLMVFMDQLASTNHRGSVALLYAAEAGIELAARDLARSADWGAVLEGGEQGTFTDGPPAGLRAIPGGGVVNLTAETNALNCGKVRVCAPAQMDVSEPERPWGANNPRWTLYEYGSLQNFNGVARPAHGYLAVWVADDSREGDDNPSSDAEDGEKGHGVLRVRAAIYGPLGSRRAAEAELTTVCHSGGAEPMCAPGIRVQSWQEVRQVTP